jgi:UDP-2,3-diacylglucosamine hydrolase
MKPMLLLPLVQKKDVLFYNMTILFISDVHLNPIDNNNHKLFINFINYLPEHTKAIYILGDLFEYWVDDKLDNIFLNNIKIILFNLTKKIPVYFIHGNRDFLINQIFATQTNIKILPQFYKINLYNYNILLTHGDYLVNDLLYCCFRTIIRNNIIINLANLLPINPKLYLARKLRSISKKNSKIYDVSQYLVEKYLKIYNSTILIHGHTHQPNIHNHSRIVLGSWEETAEILSFNQHEYKLETIK